jgi:hypothetical protein
MRRPSAQLLQRDPMNDCRPNDSRIRGAAPLPAAACFAVLLCTLAPPVPAADRDGNYAVWGVGSRSCHTFNKARGNGDSEGYENYVMGYLTAYNAIVDDTYGISGSMTLKDVMGWLDAYCGQKPMHGFEQALAEFTVQQAESRLRYPPGTPGHR